jgi:diacylglycerol kinase family enzyme
VNAAHPRRAIGEELGGAVAVGSPMAAPSPPNRPDGPVALRSVRAVINQASGSVRGDAEAQLGRVLADHGLSAQVRAVAPEEVETAVREAVDAAPDLLVLLAGDGTARFAGQLCGPDGPMLAPLAGGTMNMLPHAVYGNHSWRDALEETLVRGRPMDISGGEVDGRQFFVAAILGAPALWASAREALRKGRLRLAWLRGERALKRAFTGRLRFSLDDGSTEHAEALTLMCPLVSRGAACDDALEASALDPHGAGEAFRLGARTLLPGTDWREDPAVRVFTCRRARAWAKGRIPAVLDGEPHRLPPDVEVRFLARAFRAYAPPGAGQGEHASRREGASASSATSTSAGRARRPPPPP